MSEKEKSVVSSKELAIILIGFILGKLQESYGVGGVSPEEIYEVALFAVAVVRIMFTSSKLTFSIPGR
jgi:hypothetical protein